MKKRAIKISVLFGVFFTISYLYAGGLSFSSEKIDQKGIHFREDKEDARIQKIHYSPNKVVSIRAMTFFSTQVILGEDEFIVNVQCGDADAWTINIDKNIPNVFTLKPTLSRSHSNINVVTRNKLGNHKYYRFEVRSYDQHDSKIPIQIYAIKFLYDDHNMILKRKLLSGRAHVRIPPKIYNKRYSWSGEEYFSPKRVYDDGRFTYIVFRKSRTIPAIFSVSNRNGDESVTNFRKNKNIVVIHSIFPQITLRYGRNHVVSIFNDKLVCKRMPYRCNKISVKHGTLYRLFN